MKQRYKKVYLEITNQCNLNCSFCPKTNRTPAFLSVEQFRTAVRRIRPYTDYLYLHVMGEPLLHPQLAELLQICREEGLHITITTNGTLLSSRQELLLSGGIYKIQISLHSFEANHITQKLETYLQEVAAFAKRFSRQTDGICVLRLWNLDQADIKGENRLNQQILSCLYDLFSEYAEESAANWSEKLQMGGNSKLMDRVFLQATQKFAWPDLQNEAQDPVFCYGLRDQFAVLVDGTVVPCCLDHEGDIPLGNLFTQDLEEILTSPRAKQLYDGFSQHQAVENLCKTCQYATRFQKNK